MGFFNPNQPNFLPQQPAFIPLGPTAPGEPVIVLTPQQLAQVTEVLVESILLSPPGAGADLGINPQQLSAFLKNLLQMPKEIQQLLALMVTQDQSPTQEIIKQIIEQNPKVSLEELQKLLVQKVKQGEVQITRLLQSAQMNHTTESSKMGDLLSLVSQIGARVQASPADSLVMTMLLYLPWYPVSVHQKLQMQYQPGGDDEGEGSGESDGSDSGQLVLMIETEHMGKFRIASSLIHTNQIYFRVTHGPQANPHLEDIENRLRKSFDEQHLMSGVVEFEERAQIPALEKAKPQAAEPAMAANTPEEKTPAAGKGDQAVAVRGMGGPSIQLVQGAYLLMRLIFETDDRIDLEHKRAGA